MSLANVTETVQKMASATDSLGSVIKFAFNDADGVVLLNGNGEGNTVSNEDAEADCTVNVDFEDFPEYAVRGFESNGSLYGWEA